LSFNVLNFSFFLIQFPIINWFTILICGLWCNLDFFCV
jgi:hypothetical protein